MMKAKSVASSGKVVSGRVELETHRVLEQMARIQERTIGYLVRKAMEEYVARHTPTQKKAGG
ncbi:MAG: hypothetical protein EXS58_08810 [Candidatus Latescibacteria bacterium]|nr:hypothetical protein [Candidatus Latescibacterota bacterium]